jgi:Zn finger protein HypA/HybF involved in hydrogenase expression
MTAAMEQAGLTCPRCGGTVPVRHWQVGPFPCPLCKGPVRIGRGDRELILQEA